MAHDEGTASPTVWGCGDRGMFSGDLNSVLSWSSEMSSFVSSWSPRFPIIWLGSLSDRRENTCKKMKCVFVRVCPSVDVLVCVSHHTLVLKKRLMTPLERLSGVRLSPGTQTDMLLLSLLERADSASSVPLTTERERPEEQEDVRKLDMLCVRVLACVRACVTCYSRQGSGVGIGQRDVSFVGVCQVGVTAKLLLL